MKIRSILFAASLIAVAVPAFAQATSGAQGTMMDQSMRGMPMGKSTPCSNQTAQGTGVTEAIDRAKGTVTIKHHAISAIHWPAMTMTFQADPPSLLKGVKVGEKVNFTLHPDGLQSTVTAITRGK